MKRSLFPVAATLSLFFILVMIGCAKDPVIASQNKSNLTSGLPVNTDLGKMFGMISGVVFPMDAKPEIQLYNDVYTLGVFYPARDGSFKMPFVPAGTYHVKAHANNPAYTDEIRDVVVLTGETTIVKFQLIQW